MKYQLTTKQKTAFRAVMKKTNDSVYNAESKQI